MGTRIGNRVKDWQIKMGLPALTRGDPANHLGAVINSLLAMERALRSRKAMTDNLCIFINKNSHSLYSPLTAATIFCAASPKLSAAIISRPDAAIISLPFSTFVPSRRTTSGLVSPNVLAA